MISFYVIFINCFISLIVIQCILAYSILPSPSSASLKSTHSLVSFSLHQKLHLRTRDNVISMGTGNTFGKLFRISTYGESHGGGVGVIIDGCPPRIPLSSKEIQTELDRRRPGMFMMMYRSFSLSLSLSIYILSFLIFAIPKLFFPLLYI